MRKLYYHFTSNKLWAGAAQYAAQSAAGEARNAARSAAGAAWSAIREQFNAVVEEAFIEQEKTRI